MILGILGGIIMSYEFSAYVKCLLVEHPLGKAEFSKSLTRP